MPRNRSATIAAHTLLSARGQNSTPTPRPSRIEGWGSRSGDLARGWSHDAGHCALLAQQDITEDNHLQMPMAGGLRAFRRGRRPWPSAGVWRVLARTQALWAALVAPGRAVAWSHDCVSWAASARRMW